MLRRWQRLAPVVAGLCAAAAARAEPAQQPIEEAIAVEGSGWCIDGTSLAAQVAMWLGRPNVDARVGIAVETHEGGTAVSFHVRLGSRDVAERRFDRLPKDCQAQRAAVGLAIALAIDSAALDWLPAPEQPRWGEKPSRRGARLALAVEALLLGSVLPQITPAAYAGLESTAADLFVLRFGVVGTPAGQTDLGAGSARTSLVAARLDGCILRGSRGIEPRLCAGLLGGQVAARGRGFDRPLATQIGWAAAGLRLELRAALTRRLALHFAADGLLTLVRPRLDVEDTGGKVLYSRRLPPAGWGVGLAAVATLW